MPKRIARNLRKNLREVKRTRRAIIKDYLRGFDRKHVEDWQTAHTLKRADELLPEKILNTKTMREASKESRRLSYATFLRHLREIYGEKPSQRINKLANAGVEEYRRNRYNHERGERKAKRREIEDMERMGKRFLKAHEKFLKRQKQRNN